MAEAVMNVTKLGRRIGELEAQREREYDAFLRSLSDDQLQLAIDGFRAMKRGEPANVAAAAIITRAPDFPAHLRRELTPEEEAEIDRFVRGETP
jgi:hypothetical protein